MAIVSSCVYDAQGRLLRPSEFDVNRARMVGDFETGEALTLDRGHLHVQTVTGRGRTPAEARQRANQKLARFFDRVESVNGYRKISMSRTQGELVASGNHAVSYEIVYAIELVNRKPDRHSPESPDAGFPRGRGAAVR